LSSEYAALADIPVGHLATGRAVQLRQPVALSDTSELMLDPGHPLAAEQMSLVRILISQFRSILSVPLIIKGEPMGALTLYYVRPRSFSQEEINLVMAFGDQSALAIENARLRERAKEEGISAERSRLARDLHDSVTQMLFSASLIAEVLPTVMNRDPDEGQRALEELRQLTLGALAEMRSMLLELRPDRLQTARLEDLLRQLGESVAGRMRIPVQVEIGSPPELPPEVRLAFYRIAQESLNNITKHSSATRVDIHLYADTGGAALTISDNGYGFQPQQVPGDRLGLSLMRERANSIGAELTITSHPGQGTQVAVNWHPDAQDMTVTGRKSRHDQ
jgi:signal transduction histidine kinase